VAGPAATWAARAIGVAARAGGSDVAPGAAVIPDADGTAGTAGAACLPEVVVEPGTAVEPYAASTAAAYAAMGDMRDMGGGSGCDDCGCDDCGCDGCGCTGCDSVGCFAAV